MPAGRIGFKGEDAYVLDAFISSLRSKIKM
jgi:hypothetical protein